MKTKAAKQPKKSKASVQLKDLKTQKDAKGGSISAAHEMKKVLIGNLPR